MQAVAMGSRWEVGVTFNDGEDRQIPVKITPLHMRLQSTRVDGSVCIRVYGCPFVRSTPLHAGYRRGTGLPLPCCLSLSFRPSRRREEDPSMSAPSSKRYDARSMGTKSIETETIGARRPNDVGLKIFRPGQPVEFSRYV